MTTRLFALAVIALLGLGGCNEPGGEAEAARRRAAPPVLPTPPRPAATAPASNPKSTSPATLQQVGDCEETTITGIGSRLQGVPESGTSVNYANAASQVSYDPLPDATQSLPGDKVKLCVTEVPANCPAGDDRGFVYRATNARTGKSWTAPNSQHGCGGA